MRILAALGNQGQDRAAKRLGAAYIGMRRHGAGCACGDGDGGFRTDRPVGDQQGACACIEERSCEAGECL